MKNIRSHFVFNTKQRNGIFFLLLLIIICQLVYYFIDFSSKETSITYSEDNFSMLQAKIDSIKKLQLESEKKLFRFNPNYITDYKAYTLGMSLAEADRLFLYREKGLFLKSAEEFQKITQVSDSLLRVIAPYFRFPKQKNSYGKAKAVKLNSDKFTDLNKASPEELRRIYGVGEKLSQRIVKYRAFLGGFSLNEQLYEVYGLDSLVVKNVLKEFKILSKPQIQKRDVNTISLKELSKIPYLSFEDAKKIINYRSKLGSIISINQLTKIQGFSTEKVDRIELYLTLTKN